MNPSLTLCLPFDLTSLTLSAHLLAQKSESVAPVTETPIQRLYRWRIKNQAAFEASRINGMKRSERVRANLRRIHLECKAEWRASALRNPKLQPTDVHIAAREWTFSAPDGSIHHVRNLKKFVRDNPSLFEEADVIWKCPEGKPNQAWCRAFQGLSRLRPSGAKTLPEWQGWTWVEAAASNVRTPTSFAQVEGEWPRKIA
jgi:hypothetical protein